MILLIAWFSPRLIANDAVHSETNLEWLRGDGEDLEMRVSGVVVMPDGEPAKSATVSASLGLRHSDKKIPVEMNGNRFEAWVPMMSSKWYTLHLSAKSPDGRMRAGERIVRLDFRDAVVNGVKLTLQHSVRTVTINVVHEEKPVVGAHIDVEIEGGHMVHDTTDKNGQIKIEMLPGEVLDDMTAWTDDHRFGGFQFSRKPVRDPKADTHTIELASCRNQRIRLIDADGNAQSGVTFHLHVATPTPNYNYLGRIAASQMVTNGDGEAFFAWFPDWEKVYCYVELENDQWVKDGEEEWIDGDFVVKVKPKKRRERVTGVLKNETGSQAGFLVHWRSFQGEEERRSDHISATTDRDGRFFADVLPGATYCVFVSDREHISNMIDLIPCPVDEKQRPTAELQIEKGVPVEIRMTSGPQKRPVVDQAIHLRQVHNYSWEENGRERRGSSARDAYAYTGEDGRVVVQVIPDKKLEVSIFDPDFRTSAEKMILPDEDNVIELHREFDKPRPIVGIVMKPRESEIDFNDVTVYAGAVDAETQEDSTTMSPRKDGVFSFDSKASAVGILAVTKDGSLAGSLKAIFPRRLLRVQLKPTVTVQGKLTDPDGKPISNRRIKATVRIENEDAKRGLNQPSGIFDALSFEAMTDEEGNYVFKDVPRNIEFLTSAEATGNGKRHWLGAFTVGEKDVKRKVRIIDENED